jgi:N-sulfoglucosamine sulfohydrolase
MARIDDQGLIDEAEMIQRMWPGGLQPETAGPYIVPRRVTASPARDKTLPLAEPMEVVVYAPTQGASIATRRRRGRVRGGASTRAPSESTAR